MENDENDENDSEKFTMAPILFIYDCNAIDILLFPSIYRHMGEGEYF